MSDSNEGPSSEASTNHEDGPPQSQVPELPDLEKIAGASGRASIASGRASTARRSASRRPSFGSTATTGSNAEEEHDDLFKLPQTLPATVVWLAERTQNNQTSMSLFYDAVDELRSDTRMDTSTLNKTRAQSFAERFLKGGDIYERARGLPDVIYLFEKYGQEAKKDADELAAAAAAEAAGPGRGLHSFHFRKSQRGGDRKSKRKSACYVVLIVLWLVLSFGFSLGVGSFYESLERGEGGFLGSGIVNLLFGTVSGAASAAAGRVGDLASGSYQLGERMFVGTDNYLSKEIVEWEEILFNQSIKFYNGYDYHYWTHVNITTAQRETAIQAIRRVNTIQSHISDVVGDLELVLYALRTEKATQFTKFLKDIQSSLRLAEDIQRDYDDMLITLNTQVTTIPIEADELRRELSQLAAIDFNRDLPTDLETRLGSRMVPAFAASLRTNHAALRRLHPILNAARHSRELLSEVLRCGTTCKVTDYTSITALTTLLDGVYEKNTELLRLRLIPKGKPLDLLNSSFLGFSCAEHSEQIGVILSSARAPDELLAIGDGAATSSTALPVPSVSPLPAAGSPLPAAGSPLPSALPKQTVLTFLIPQSGFATPLPEVPIAIHAATQPVRPTPPAATETAVPSPTGTSGGTGGASGGAPPRLKNVEIPFEQFEVNEMAFDADDYLTMTPFLDSLPEKAKTMMNSTTITIGTKTLNPLELLIKLEGLQQIERTYTAAKIQAEMVHRANTEAHLNSTLATAMVIAEFDKPLDATVRQRVEKHLRFFINEYGISPKERAVKQIVNLIRVHTSDTLSVADARTKMANREKIVSNQKPSVSEILFHLISTPFYYTPLDWGANTSGVAGLILLVGVALSIWQPCACCSKCQDVGECCCICCDVQSSDPVQAQLMLTSPAAGVPAGGSGGLGGLIESLGSENEIEIVIRRGGRPQSVGPPGTSAALGNRASAAPLALGNRVTAASSGALLALGNRTSAAPSSEVPLALGNRVPTASPPAFAAAAPVVPLALENAPVAAGQRGRAQSPKGHPPAPRSLLGPAAPNPAYNATASSGPTLSSLLQRAYEGKGPNYLKTMAGADPEVYVRAIVELRRRMTDDRYDRVKASTGLENLRLALQAHQVGDNPYLSNTYDQLMGNSALRERFVAAVRGTIGGGGGAAGGAAGGAGGSRRKNRTYRKRKSSRKSRRNH